MLQVEFAAHVANLVEENSKIFSLMMEKTVQIVKITST